DCGYCQTALSKFTLLHFQTSKEIWNPGNQEFSLLSWLSTLSSQRSTVLLILLSEAISIEKRYFTSDLSSRSYASLTFCRSEWQMPQNRISICTSRSARIAPCDYARC